jgi:hypothetical protein
MLAIKARPIAVDPLGSSAKHLPQLDMNKSVGLARQKKHLNQK